LCDQSLRNQNWRASYQWPARLVKHIWLSYIEKGQTKKDYFEGDANPNEVVGSCIRSAV
jgi:hypothetical protein